MATIAIFDSGVGGLSVYRELALQCPQHNFIFISDNQAFPYGTKTAAELSERVIKVVAALIEQYTPDLLVVACNTASTVTLPALRAGCNIPIVGVVPAIKPAAALTQSNVIGILATPATINRAYTNELISEFASECEVVRLGSSQLVQMAEDKLRGQSIDRLQLERILEPFIRAQRLDVLVLACTHFPLLNNEISSFFKHKSHPIKIIDSGAAIAKRVSGLLEGESTKNASPFASSADDSVAVFTQQVDDAKLIENLSKQGFHNLQVLLVD